MRYRATKPADLRIARDFLPAGYRYSPELRDALPQIWECLLRSGQLNSMVLEGPDQCVLGVGLSVFVADYFAERELAAPRPYLNARLHEMIRAGHSPVLDQRAIAKGNSEPGLTLMPLHFCTASFDTSDPEIIRILLAAQDTFRITHAGFRVKRMLKEVVGINLCRYMVSCGMSLHCDHASDAKIRGLAEDEHPYLLAVNHAEMPLGSTLSTMFAPTSRRFHFSPAEQKLLRSAILLEADEDIAAELNLSRDTLRKQWRSIYERVRHVDPQFFPEDAVLAQDDGVRGRGKRRHLLQYLQLYMEELRPYQKKRGGVFAHAWSSPRPGAAVRRASLFGAVENLVSADASLAARGAKRKRRAPHARRSRPTNATTITTERGSGYTSVKFLVRRHRL